MAKSFIDVVQDSPRTLLVKTKNPLSRTNTPPVEPPFDFKLRRKSILPRLNSSRQRSESSTRCCLWSGVSKRGTHFENNLRIPKD